MSPARASLDALQQVKDEVEALKMKHPEVFEDDPPPDVVSHFMDLKRQFPGATYQGKRPPYSSREDHHGR